LKHPPQPEHLMKNGRSVRYSIKYQIVKDNLEVIVDEQFGQREYTVSSVHFHPSGESI